jgi:hypothetical protein
MWRGLAPPRPDQRVAARRTMSTERGTACAVRSDTLRRPETPLRPRLPVTTSAAPNVRAAAPRRGGEARDVVHHREGSSLANAPTGVSGTGTTAIPLPRTALQILAIDLATETLPALALGASRPSRTLMGLTVRAIRDSDPSAVHLLRHAVRGLQDLARQRVGVLGQQALDGEVDGVRRDDDQRLTEKTREHRAERRRRHIFAFGIDRSDDRRGAGSGS